MSPKQKQDLRRAMQLNQLARKKKFAEHLKDGDKNA